jgi:hypothetical protein
VISLQTPIDYLIIFLVTAIAGLIGGLAAELLLTRNEQTGTFELPTRREGVFDFGGFASLLIGAVVGVAILIVFPPETTIITNTADGTTTSFRAYDVVRLVVTSLVAGSAGGSVLSGLQARLSAAINESRIQFTSDTAQLQLQQMRETATSLATDQIRAANAPHGAGGARSRGALEDPAPPGAEPNPADDAIAALDAALGRQADQAKATIAAAATSRRR